MASTRRAAQRAVGQGKRRQRLCLGAPGCGAKRRPTQNVEGPALRKGATPVEAHPSEPAGCTPGSTTARPSRAWSAATPTCGEPPVTVARLEERRKKLLALWLGVAVLFAALLGVARATRTGLDDPDPAWQRPGFLDAGPLPQPDPRLSAELPRSGRPAVVFFVRPADVAELCHSLTAHRLGESAELVIVVSGTGRCPGVTALEDPGGALPRAYGLRDPRNGVTPVGYALIDGQGRIRYRTLDPTVANALDEVDTVLGALP